MKEKTNLRRSICLLIPLLSFFICVSQKNPTGFLITGKVSDETGSPLQGVTVQVKETSATTITKQDGTYQITVPSETSILLFSYVGYEAQSVNVGGKNEISLAMKLSVNSMSDVVVIGYG